MSAEEVGAGGQGGGSRRGRREGLHAEWMGGWASVWGGTGRGGSGRGESESVRVDYEERGWDEVRAGRRALRKLDEIGIELRGPV